MLQGTAVSIPDSCFVAVAFQSEGRISLKNHFTSCSVNAPRNSSLNSRFLFRCSCISVKLEEAEEAPISSANMLLSFEDSSSPWTDKEDAELVINHIKNKIVFRTFISPLVKF